MSSYYVARFVILKWPSLCQAGLLYSYSLPDLFGVSTVPTTAQISLVLVERAFSIYPVQS